MIFDVFTNHDYRRSATVVAIDALTGHELIAIFQGYGAEDRAQAYAAWMNELERGGYGLEEMRAIRDELRAIATAVGARRATV
jgi:hypothetical protein